MSWTVSYFLTLFLRSGEKIETWVDQLVMRIGPIKVFLIFAIIFVVIFRISILGAIFGIGLVTMPNEMKKFNQHLEGKEVERFEQVSGSSAPVLGAFCGIALAFFAPMVFQMIRGTR